MVEILLNTPVLVKIIISLLVIILANKLLSNQVFSVLAGTIVLALWAGHNLDTAYTIAAARFTSIDNIFLLIVIVVIISLSSQMRESGIMDDLVTNLTRRFSRTTSMALLPAVIGLLPMPGGAMFSAPLVDRCDPETEINPLLKSRINYWFRHIWEYWWPLYPGVLLAIDISGLQVSQFMIFLFPLTIFSVAGAWFFLLRKTEFSLKETDHFKDAGAVIGPPVPGFIFLISPILLIIIIYAVLNTIFPALSAFSKYLPIMIGIISSVIYLQVIRPLGPAVWKKILFSRKLISLVLLVAIIRIYGAYVEGRLPDGTLLMESLRAELSAAGISPYILIMLLPFFCGISTGIAIGTVGAAFPIVMSLIGPEPGFPLLVSTTALAYSFGHVGQLLSPVHVCLLVSNEYFNVGLGKSIAGLIKPSLIVLASGFLLSRLYLFIL
ncbi:MAG: DUF401 family protein [Spirochaetales bacterium]|nr:DUF401 family protein [Spirochaetales bacterium]